MKRGVRSYLVFTSRAYRLILFVLVPAAVIGLQVGLAVYWKGTAGSDTVIEQILEAAGIVMFVMAILMTMAEVLVDYWAFGGIAIKGGGSLEYLKSSPKGKKLVRTALRTDMIRMLLESTVVLILGKTAWAIPAGGFERLLQLQDLALILAVVLCQYFATMTALLVARHFESFQIYMSAAAIAYMAQIPLFVLCSLNCYCMLAVMAVLSIVVSAISQWKIMRRVEESYYDQRL